MESLSGRNKAESEDSRNLDVETTPGSNSAGRGGKRKLSMGE
jgi:hypothetical protein